ncbi:hypothetical protein [Caulobacter mirabilis]|uniref:Uncharacterized protein n=1 Tax=Caulobacter mirabilis TaxID=69666 RepID=A0A2D2B0Z6_9CAUL|nr:hypothetical protein [Caulobacter mirabilis]ATQ43918.1 hypothetical protein CSW64_16730 [Caulobacter mirabilis]
MIRAAILGLGLAAATATAAWAAPAQEHELRSLGQCALAASLYESLAKPGSPIVLTDADKALIEKMDVAEPTLSKRANTLAETIGKEKAKAVHDKLMTEFKAQLAPEGKPRLPPREALDRYAPIMESCIARSQLLSGLAG